MKLLFKVMIVNYEKKCIDLKNIVIFCEMLLMVIHLKYIAGICPSTFEQLYNSVGFYEDNMHL